MTYRPTTPGSFHAAQAVAVNTFEREFITAAIAKADGNLASVVRQTGLSQSSLTRLMRKHGFRSDDPNVLQARIAALASRLTRAQSKKVS